MNSEGILFLFLAVFFGPIIIRLLIVLAESWAEQRQKERDGHDTSAK